jgi:hypothetical protein
MAIGLPARFSDTVALSVPRETARIAAEYALEALGWPFEHVDRDNFVATVWPSMSSWGERVEISLGSPAVLEIRSYGLNPFQIFDWGKNARNVRAFIEIFEAKAAREGKTHPEERVHFDKERRTPTDRALAE